MLRICAVVLLLLSGACGAPRSRFAGMTMPSPDGCFVQVWDGPSFVGASDYMNGPSVYPSLRDLPGGRLWQDRIRSAKVGPAASVTAWSDENLQGSTMRLVTDTEYPRLPEAMTAQIESMAVECAGRATE